MKDKSWDPLDGSETSDAELASASKKRQIKNILKSYVGMYDSFSELIQNSMDATDRRLTELSEDGYQKKLYLTVDLSKNLFSITDNGIGLNEQEFKSFLAPNVSFKDGGLTRGNKGVGATYLGYGFDYFEFGTKGNGHSFVGKIEKCRTWVEDYKGIITRPLVHACKPTDKNFEKIDRGSTFTIKVGSSHDRPKSLSWYSAKKAQQWLYLFLIKTPLGTVYYENDERNDIEFSIEVIDKNGNVDTLEDMRCEYIYPHNEIQGSVNLKEVRKAQQVLINLNKDASNLPKKFYKSNGIYEYFDNDDLLSLINTTKGKYAKNIDDYIGYITDYEIEAYGYFAYTTEIWDKFNDDKAKLRKGYRVLKGGLQLANNRMVQGDTSTIPLTSNIGYQNQCHVLIHFKNADPDLGRKGFQPELKDVSDRLAVLIVNNFKPWRKLLKNDTGAKPIIEKEVALDKWIKDQEKHEEESPLVIKNKNFFNPINEISITSLPQSEQDTVVLFNQLIAGGVIRGIKLLATSQIKQYDGVYRFYVKRPFSNHEYDKKKNPLGVVELHYSDELITPPRVLEYKYILDGLIREFENETKYERDISLAVCWDLGSEWKKNYDIVSLLDLDNIHRRDFHGVTHILDSGTNTCKYPPAKPGALKCVSRSKRLNRDATAIPGDPKSPV